MSLVPAWGETKKFPVDSAGHIETFCIWIHYVSRFLFTSLE